MSEKSNGYKWYGIGDINAFFGLMFDNMTVLLFMSNILIFVFQFPAEIIYTKMIPGTTLGVLIGDLVYTWMAFQLAKKTGNRNVTAMPLGLDTPSTIGIAFAVLGPVYVQTKDPILTWQVGMATLVLIGIVKVVLSFFGEYVQKIVPQAGLLGSLAGIGLCLIGFLPLLKIFAKPVCGLIALGLIFYALVARIKLPRNAPGVLISILAGTVIYYVLGKSGWGGLDAFEVPKLVLSPGFPAPTLDFMKGLNMAWNYLPIAIPFALLTVV
ncbi:MAG: hypothetical protein HYU64_18085, partial [Armatimonadetes bacterium]|nr:hypothetical protein [Armatimonadota bacterium]